MTRPVSAGPDANPAFRFFFLDTTFAVVLAAICLIGGWLSWTNMTREQHPDLAIPQATIVASWPGATPAQVEEQVTRPLEDAVRSLPGLRTYTASSQNSAAVMAVEFRADVSIEVAMRDLRTRVEEARARFPSAVKVPEVQQVAVGDVPILTFTLFGAVDDETLLRAAQALDRRIEQVAGVRRAELQGARDRAVHIRLDPARLRLLGLSATDVRGRIEQANQDLAWGEFEGADGTLPLYLEGRFRELDDIRSIVITRLNGDRIVRLDEVADVFIGLRERERATQVSYEGSPFGAALSMSVLKRPGADTLAVIADVRAAMETHTSAPDWAQAIELVETSAEAEQIEASFAEITSSLDQGVAAVFVILLIALTWREAAVAALALPVAMLAALLILNTFGYTLNTLIIIGAVIALGIIVDVFILVMEGMHDALYVKKMRFEAAVRDTVATYLMPALAGQATTILTMVPLLTISGIDGKFIRQIPIAAIACLVTSLLLAFLVALPLSRWVLDRKAEVKETAVDWLAAKGGRGLMRLLLAGPIRNRWTAGGLIALCIGALVLTLDAASRLPTIVYPPEDRRNLGATITLRPDAPLTETEAVATRVGEALQGFEWIESVTLHAGEASPFTLSSLSDYLQDNVQPNILGVSVRLVPKEEREEASFDLFPLARTALEGAVADVPGADLRLSADLGGSGNADPIAIEVRGGEVDDLRSIATEITALMRATPGVEDVRDSLGAFRTEARFTARPEALSFYGIDEPALMEQVRIAMTSDEVGTYPMPGTEPDLQIRLGMDFPSRADGEIGGPRELFELETMAVVTPQGERVPVANLIDTDLREVPGAILRTEGDRAVTISARPGEGVTSLGVVDALRPEIEAMAADWPQGTSWRFRGEAESSAETFGSTAQAMVVAVGLVFAVLALLFRSFRQPLIIMTIAPLSLMGVFGGFAALNIPISFPAMIGVIALIGIIVNDSIVIVQVTNGHLANGMTIREAAAHGAADRLRPILTTSVTTIVGLTPLAVSSPVWFPLCMAVILGLSVGTILALLTVPALYVLLTSRKRAQAADPEPQPV